MEDIKVLFEREKANNEAQEKRFKESKSYHETAVKKLKTTGRKANDMIDAAVLAFEKIHGVDWPGVLSDEKVAPVFVRELIQQHKVPDTVIPDNTARNLTIAGLAGVTAGGALAAAGYITATAGMFSSISIWLAGGVGMAVLAKIGFGSILVGSSVLSGAVLGAGGLVWYVKHRSDQAKIAAKLSELQLSTCGYQVLSGAYVKLNGVIVSLEKALKFLTERLDCLVKEMNAFTSRAYAGLSNTQKQQFCEAAQIADCLYRLISRPVFDPKELTVTPQMRESIAKYNQLIEQKGQLLAAPALPAPSSKTKLTVAVVSDWALKGLDKLEPFINELKISPALKDGLRTALSTSRRLLDTLVKGEIDLCDVAVEILKTLLYTVKELAPLIEAGTAGSVNQRFINMAANYSLNWLNATNEERRKNERYAAYYTQLTEAVEQMYAELAPQLASWSTQRQNAVRSFLQSVEHDDWGRAANSLSSLAQAFGFELHYTSFEDFDKALKKGEKVKLG